MNLRARYGRPHQPVVTAHRGFSGRYPENTLLAFAKALDLGVDIVEFDVRASVDGHLVLMHDATVDRTTNGKGPVDQMTLAELKQLDASSHWPGRAAGAGSSPMVAADVAIPALEEALEALAGKVGLNIQVKITSRDMLEKIIRLYLDYELTDSGFLMLRSFEQGAWVRSLSSDVAICIGEDRHDLEKHLAFGVDYLQPRARCLTDAYIDALIQSGVPANVFYANDPETMATFIRKGIPGIMTDYPDLLMSLAGSR